MLLLSMATVLVLGSPNWMQHDVHTLEVTAGNKQTSTYTL